MGWCQNRDPDLFSHISQPAFELKLEWDELSKLVFTLRSEINAVVLLCQKSPYGESFRKIGQLWFVTLSLS